MTLVSQIITDAYRKTNLIANGASPSTAQVTEGLRYLNRVVKSVFGMEVGDQLEAFPIGDSGIVRPTEYPGWTTTPQDGDWFVPQNSRLMLNLGEAVSLYLHPKPSPGARFAVADVANNLSTYNVTVYGNGRLIEGAASVTLNTDGETSEWFYRPDTASWTKYATLLSTDTFPFPEEFEDWFIVELALRINPSYGTMIDDQTMKVYRRIDKQLKATYKTIQEKRSPLALVFLPSARRYGYLQGSTVTEERFNAGYPF